MSVPQLLHFASIRNILGCRYLMIKLPLSVCEALEKNWYKLSDTLLVGYTQVSHHIRPVLDEIVYLEFTGGMQKKISDEQTSDLHQWNFIQHTMQRSFFCALLELSSDNKISGFFLFAGQSIHINNSSHFYWLWNLQGILICNIIKCFYAVANEKITDKYSNVWI